MIDGLRNVYVCGLEGVVVVVVVNSLQTQKMKSHQMKDGSGGLIVNMLTQVECMVVDSLVEVKVDVLHS